MRLKEPYMYMNHAVYTVHTHLYFIFIIITFNFIKIFYVSVFLKSDYICAIWLYLSSDNQPCVHPWLLCWSKPSRSGQLKPSPTLKRFQCLYQRWEMPIKTSIPGMEWKGNKKVIKRKLLGIYTKGYARTITFTYKQRAGNVKTKKKE